MPNNAIFILKNILRRCKLENASFSNDKKEDAKIKEALRLYLVQDTAAIVQALIDYAEGVTNLDNILLAKRL